MLFRKHIVSTRTLLQLTVAVLFFVAAVGAAVAANSGNPPLLVPYTATTVAGNPQNVTSGKGTSSVSGFSGDGGPAVPYASSNIGTPNAVVVSGALLATPYGTTVDSVGNVYIADQGNYVIREVNSATGVINTIAGVPHAAGCADGVPAIGGKIGKNIYGIAVDSFGNVYYADSASSTVSVVYRAGKRVADFIAMVDPGGVARSNGSAQVGYVYHVGGTINLSSCAGSTGSSTGATVDNVLAFEDISVSGAVPNAGATLHGAQNITLDSAGNIYVSDNGNDTVRVINTQKTPQTFFEYTVQPGYMRSITNCNPALTTPCAALDTYEVGTGYNGPVNGLRYANAQGSGSSFSFREASADQYGNVFQDGQRECVVAFAGGSPLVDLLTVETPSLSGIYSATETGYPVPVSDAPTPNELPLAYGNAYIMIGDPAIISGLPDGYLAVFATADERFASDSSSIWADSFGTMYYRDTHFATVSRIDQFTSDATFLFGNWANTTHGRQGLGLSPSGLATVVNSNGTTSNYAQPPTFANPWDCIWGSSSGPWIDGPQTYDVVGDGCPALLAAINPAGKYDTSSDGLSNLYVSDTLNDLIREVTVGTQFPATWVGAPQSLPSAAPPVQTGPVTQPIQVHFDATNIPVTNGAPDPHNPTYVPGSTAVGLTQKGATGGTAYTTDAFSIPAGSDFSIDTTTPEFPMGVGFDYEGAFKENTSNGLVMYPTLGSQGYPTCFQFGGAAEGTDAAEGLVDTSWDCLVYVKFNPTQPGLRTGQLLVTTANGSSYTFTLTGIGVGGQLAIDGGQQTPVQETVGSAAAVAVDSLGNIYTADPADNEIVVTTSAVGGTQTVIGPSIAVVSPVFNQAGQAPVQSTLKGPMGVAVDGADNVYISDTGNNRILKYSPATQTATLLGQYLWVPGAACDGGASSTSAMPNCAYTGFVVPGSPSGTPAPTSILNDPGSSVTATAAPAQYAFKAPQGLAVDAWGNVYVADTGNAAVVEIPSNTALGGATPLMQYPGAPTFTSPVAVAVDSKGFVYVADTGNAAGQILQIPPGGGDLQPSGNATSALNVIQALPTFDGQSVTTANGVAVDGAGNVYVSDKGTNTVVEAPVVPSGLGGITLSFSGLSGPAGLALDANGNLYVADSGNNRVLQMNRQSPVVPFGTVPQDLAGPSGVAGTPAGCPALGSSTPCTGVLTVTNIGNQPVTITQPFLSAPTNPQFTVSSTCTNPINAGTTCTITPFFTPTSDGPATDNVTVNGSQSIAMMGGVGANPEVNIVLSTPTLAPTASSSPVITATVRQPHVLGVVPTGTVTFNYTIDANTPNATLCGANGSSGSIALSPTGVATFPIPSVGAGLVYTVSAVYNGDTNDSTTNATPIALTVPPATVETVTATSVTYTYGQPVPAITGTESPTLPAGVTVSFVGINNNGVDASQFSPPGTYPITAVFAGGTTATEATACGLGSPPVTTTGNTQATVTENKAALTAAVGTFTTPYGTIPPVNFATGLTITGALGTDAKELSATYTTGIAPPPLDSALLPVGSYPVVATLTGKPINSGDYTVTATPGTLTVTQAPAGIAVTAASQTGANPSLGLGAATYVTETAMTSTTFPITVSTLISAGLGVPTGSVTVYDTFIPITASVFVPTGTSDSIPPQCSSTLTSNCLSSGSSVILPCAAGAAPSTSCTQPVVVPLTAGNGTFSLPASSGTPSPYYTGTGSSAAVVPGTHYFTFLYSGDTDFSCSVVGQTTLSTGVPIIPGGTTCASTGSVSTVMIVDNQDYTLTSTTGAIGVIPGNIPSGNGLPTLPNQNTAEPQSAIIEIGGIQNFTGTVSLTCATQFSYETCFAGQIAVVNSTVQLLTSVTLPFVPSGQTTESYVAPFIFDVQMPATLPLGYTPPTAQLRTSAGRMVLAFLPLGFVAFCVRRRRRLSKALWMLIAIAAVSAGMSGCSGNQVSFYTPIPTGPQSVTVTASYAGNGSTLPPVTRSYVVSIIVD